MDLKEAVAQIAEFNKPISLEVNPGEALAMIGQLQLALRCPGNNGPSAQFVQELIRVLAQAIADLTSIDQVYDLVAMGDHPEFDLTDAEADAVFSGNLNLQLSLRKNYDKEALHQALALLAQQSSDPDTTLNDWRNIVVLAENL